MERVLLSAITGRAIGDDTLEPHLLAAGRDGEKLPTARLAWAMDRMTIAS